MARLAPEETPAPMELQLEQDLSFQERDWRVQRIAMLLMLVFILVGLSGLLGPGPLSHAHARSADDSVSVDYLRWARRGGKANLTVIVDQAQVRDGRLRVEVPMAYFEDMELEAVTPQPEQVEASGSTMRFIFAAPRADGPVTLEFDVQGQGMGPVRGELRVHDTIVRFQQFLWP